MEKAGRSGGRSRTQERKRGGRRYRTRLESLTPVAAVQAAVVAHSQHYRQLNIVTKDVACVSCFMVTCSR